MECFRRREPPSGSSHDSDICNFEKCCHLVASNITTRILLHNVASVSVGGRWGINLVEKAPERLPEVNRATR